VSKSCEHYQFHSFSNSPLLHLSPHRKYKSNKSMLRNAGQRTCFHILLNSSKKSGGTVQFISAKINSCVMAFLSFGSSKK